MWVWVMDGLDWWTDLWGPVLQGLVCVGVCEMDGLDRWTDRWGPGLRGVVCGGGRYGWGGLVDGQVGTGTAVVGV